MTVKTKTTGPKVGNRKKSALMRATGATESAVNIYLQGLPPGILKKLSANELAWIYTSVKAKETRKLRLQDFSRRIRNATSALRGRWTMPIIKWKWIPQPTMRWTELKGWPVQALQAALLIVRGRK